MAISRPGWPPLRSMIPLLVFVGGFGFSMGTASGQPTSEPPIEVWQGLKKVSGKQASPRAAPTEILPVPTPLPEPVQTPHHPMPIQVPTMTPMDGDIFHELRQQSTPIPDPPIEVSPPIPTSFKPPIEDFDSEDDRSTEQQQAAQAWARELSGLVESLRVGLVEKTQPVIEVFGTEESSAVAKSESTPDDKVTHTANEANATPMSWLGSISTGPEMLFYAGVLVISPLMFLLGLVIVLKRAGVLNSPVVRIEVVNGVVGTGGSVDHAVAGHPMMAELPIAEEFTQPPVRDEDLVGLLPPDDYQPQTFDIGPSFEDDRIAREDALKNQSQALLAQVFEQNMRLQQQLPNKAMPLAEEIDPIDSTAPQGPVTEDNVTPV